MQLKAKILIGISALAVLGAIFWLIKPERPEANIGQVTASQPLVSANSVNSGLIQKFTFDGLDFVTGTTTDSSGNSNLMLNTGVKTDDGVIGQSIYCDGKSYATRANASLNNFSIGTSSFSISYWVKTKTIAAGTQYIWGKVNSAPYYYVGITTAGKSDIFLRGDTMSADTVSLKTVTDNKWHNITYIVNRTSTSYVYIDGALDKTFDITTKSDETLDNTNLLRMCASGAGTPSNYFTGSVDEFRFYNRAISVAEMTRLYNQGKNNLDVASTLTSGLAIWHGFDGGYVTGTVSIDRGSSPANLTRNGTTGKTTAKGVVGQAYLMPDNTSFLRTTAGASFTCATGTNAKFSFSGWVNTSGGASVKHLISLRNGTNADNCFALTLSNSTGKLNFNFPNATAGVAETESTGTISPNKWYHVGVTYNGATNVATYYINGAKDSSYSPSTTVVNAMVERVADRISIGSRAIDGAANFYQGYVDDFRVYQRTLSDREMSELYNLGKSNIAESWTKTLLSGLVGHWTFDGDKTSATAFTASIGSNLTRSGIKTGQGVIGQSALGNGTLTSYAANQNAINIGVGAQYAMSVWVRNTQPLASTYRVAMSIGSSTYGAGHYAYLGVHSTNLLGGGVFNSGSELSSAITPVLNKWYHLVQSFDGTTTSLYVNGALVDSSTNANMAVTVTSTVVNINYFGGSGLNWYGNIDDARVYNRALTAGEIYKLYKMGK